MIQPPPRNRGESWKSLALAAGVHLALVGALFVGVQWKSNPPAAVEVELWDRVPVQPAPPPPPPPEPKPEPKPEPEPPPPPPPKVEPKPEPKPDIAVKEEKKEKPKPKKEPDPKKGESKKTEVKPPPRSTPDFRAQVEQEEKRLAQQQRIREEQARAEDEMRVRAEADAERAAAARKRGLADYQAKISGKIRGNTVLPPAIQGNPEAVFEVVQLPSGEIVGTPRLKKSSGNPNLDAAIERAILKSSPLPRPDLPELFQRVLEIRYRPNDE
jgi:colicin import membrane protein